jgi:hypothetical protein
MNVEVMLYKPYDLAGACEKFVIAATNENRDAAQMSPQQCEKIDDHTKERGSARAARRSGLVISVISKVRYPEPKCCLHNAKPH